MTATTALIGAAGVILGAACTGLVNVLLSVQLAAKNRRGAVRPVASELRHVQAALALVSEDTDPDEAVLMLPSPTAWEEHRGTLDRELDDDSGTAVRDAYVVYGSLLQLLAAVSRRPADERARQLIASCVRIAEASVQLAIDAVAQTRESDPLASVVAATGVMANLIENLEDSRKLLHEIESRTAQITLETEMIRASIRRMEHFDPESAELPTTESISYLERRVFELAGKVTELRRDVDRAGQQTGQSADGTSAADCP